MNIKRYDIFPVNHQAGNEIENTDGRYVRFEDVSDLQQRLADAERRNAELVVVLKNCLGRGLGAIDNDIRSAIEPSNQCTLITGEFVCTRPGGHKGRCLMLDRKVFGRAALNKPEEVKP